MPNDTFDVTLPPNVGGGAYATAVNDAIEEIREKLEPKVPTSALNIDADLDFGNHRAVDLKGLTLTAQASETTPLTLYTKANDWYVRDGAGNEIRLTAAGALNAGVTDLNGAHGARFIQMPAHLGGIVTGTPIYYTNGKGVGSAGGACSFYSWLPPLRRGDRILSISARFFRGLGPGTVQIEAYRLESAAPVSIGGPVSSTATPGGDLDLTISGLTRVVATGESFCLFVQIPVAQDVFETLTIEYDRP